MNKSSETKKPKDNISGASNAGNNKNKYYKQKKKDQQSNTNSSATNLFLQSAPTADRMVTWQLNPFNNPRGGGLQRQAREFDW